VSDSSLSPIFHTIFFESEGHQEATTITVKENDLDHPPLILDELDLLRLGPESAKNGST
jgi:hypothetical protein